MITNSSIGFDLVDDHRLCRSLWSKATGLMFRKRLENRAFVFEFSSERIRSLHMWFVFYPIDVLFLDQSRKVVDIKKNFRPFEVYTPEKNCKYVIEMPAGSVKATEIGDTIIF
ncbi:DUF192 domain-containing protein [Candidatus Woesearchaeota archaeon]|nr:DUF192 domain-containing protein [Candidatus Woesearchaeota archaeon]